MPLNLCDGIKAIYPLSKVGFFSELNRIQCRGGGEGGGTGF